MVMVFSYYIVGTYLVSLLGFAFLFFLRSNKKGKKKDSGEFKLQTNAVNGSDIGECSPEYGSGDDVIIIGASVAGAALAYTLGKDGRRVHVIKRDLTEPDRIVGELLQPGGYLKLVELGLEHCVEEIDAQRVLGYALFKDGRNTRLSHPLAKFHADVAGRSFHNGRFIQRMKTATLSKNGTIRGVQCITKDGQELRAYAPLTIVDVPSCFVGLVLETVNSHFQIMACCPSRSFTHLYPISGTEVCCLVDVPRQKVASIANDAMANYLKTVVAPQCLFQVPPDLHDAFIAAVDKGNIRIMANRSMPADPHPTPEALLMGDAFNMRHPLTGGEMTVVLSDIVVLRDLLRPLHDFHDAASLTKYLDSFYTLCKPVPSTINTLAGALYKVFSASPDQARKEMHEACFDGDFSTRPVALLSGLNPRPLSLSASGIILPIIKAEGVRQMFFPATVLALYKAPHVV
ncbi:hypothetical protein PTKIN_Ptkin07bG0257400 [Pterospermum kingtungense]